MVHCMIAFIPRQLIIVCGLEGFRGSFGGREDEPNSRLRGLFEGKNSSGNMRSFPGIVRLLNGNLTNNLRTAKSLLLSIGDRFPETLRDGHLPQSLSVRRLDRVREEFASNLLLAYAFICTLNWRKGLEIVCRKQQRVSKIRNSN